MVALHYTVRTICNFMMLYLYTVICMASTVDTYYTNTDWCQEQHLKIMPHSCAHGQRCTTQEQYLQSFQS